jgi:TolB-like protein
MDRTPDIFLSYNREDQAAAKRFAEGFEAAGLSVWWDVTLRSGEAYDEVTEAALRGAEAVVVLWSTRSVASRWVRAEATLADRNRTLVPARIEGCDLPIMFELTQTADLSNWRGEDGDPVWHGFLEDVRRLVGRRRRATESERPPARAPSVQPSRGRKPSIAVLPFINRSTLEEDDVFADGMVEDLTAALTVSRKMKVITASATAAYRTGAMDLRQIGRDLGVRYLLEGNVRRVGANLRVTAQLVEAEEGDILWIQKFDRPLSELAALQEDLTAEVAAHLGVQVERAEMEQALKKPDDITAWQAVLRASAYLGSVVQPNIEAAIAEARRAIAIEPDYDLAQATLAVAQALLFRTYRSDDLQLRQEVLASVARAQATSTDDPVALARIGAALDFVNKPQDALPFARRAVSLNPNLELPHISLGNILDSLGRWDEAIAEFEAADRIAPNGYWTNHTLYLRGVAHLCAGRPELGLDLLERSLVISDVPQSQILRALCQAESDAIDSGRETLRRLRAVNPDLSLGVAESHVRGACKSMGPDGIGRYLEVFRDLWNATGGDS